jgi:sugar/nucleoside kinase (ribokinase family)
VDIKAPKVKAVDGTGAGDALNGALAAALAGGADLTTAARRAVVAATLSVTRAGAREGMPTLAELQAALGEPMPGRTPGPEAASDADTGAGASSPPRPA